MFVLKLLRGLSPSPPLQTLEPEKDTTLLHKTQEATDSKSNDKEKQCQNLMDVGWGKNLVGAKIISFLRCDPNSEMLS